MKHIVDQLIEERAQGLMQRPLAWQFVKRFLYPVLGYSRAIVMIDMLTHVAGIDVFRWLSRRLQMRVEVDGLENLPAEGLALVVANHPAGIADGIALWDAISARRQDVTFFANRDATRAVPGLHEVIIPVEWLEENRTRERSKETVRQTIKAFRSERLIVIFPSGRLARLTVGGLVEREWLPTAVSLAQKYNCPIVPVHINGRNSWLYYLFYFLNTELRDMTLFRELLNKRGQKYQVRIARPFVPEGDTAVVTTALRAFVADAMPDGADEFVPHLNGTAACAAGRTPANAARASARTVGKA